MTVESMLYVGFIPNYFLISIFKKIIFCKYIEENNIFGNVKNFL